MLAFIALAATALLGVAINAPLAVMYLRRRPGTVEDTSTVAASSAPSSEEDAA